MKKQGFAPKLIGVGVGLLVLFAAALMVGRYTISPSSFFGAIFTGDSSLAAERSVILNLRLPRTVVACLTGIALSVSGLLYQETFRNELVSPDLLGVSNGAAVGAAIAILIGLPTLAISACAFILGLATVGLTLLVSKLFRDGTKTTLVLSGVIVSGFMAAILSIVKFAADPDTTLATITYWLMGSFEDSSMTNVWIMLPIVGLCLVLLLVFGWRLNVISLGREEAQTKGLNYGLYRLAIIAISTLLTASSVACCGTVSWIGLVIPHAVRLIVGRDARRTLPFCALLGGAFMIGADVLSRTFTASELPLSAITGVLGTAGFVAILFFKRKEVTIHD